MVEVKFARLREGAIIPSKRDEDAGYDIYACIKEPVVIKPLDSVMIPTGIASVIPEGYYMQIEERGSTGSKGIKRSCGVMDTGFRGEWFVVITNCSDRLVVIAPEGYEDMFREMRVTMYPAKKAIAQAVLHEVIPSKVTEITPEELALYPSERGSGSLGSSNK
ncbi:MAG: dUTP pyrophosphatase [Lachnospiraceae bacterium]|nr:dUTP pyrophosphatase [Lachnospiraceae bacterium]